MENIKDIKEWRKVNYGSGFGNGNGSGSGFGDGNGYGFGNGNGNGNGNGSGDGNGYGFGDGNGSGDGNGYGYGNGNGNGYKYNGNTIYNSDGVNTIIKAIKGQIAKGFIVNEDLTLITTFVVKDTDSKHFAHGETVKKAFKSLEEKIIADLDVDDRLTMFLKDVDKNKKYTLKYFFEWHGKLTGSCLQGREAFIQNKGLNLEDEIDFEEFIEICRGQYGWEIIKKLI